MFADTDPDIQLIRTSIQDVCRQFDDSYWMALDDVGGYPQDFVNTLTELGWLGMLIPEEYGGGGMGLMQASVVLEEIHRSGGNAAACHAQMYTMGTLLRHGRKDQRDEWLPRLASGEARLQAFAVTEPDAGSDTTKITTSARREGAGYVINGRKTFISRVEFSDLLILLARTTPLTDVDRKTDGLSLFLIDLREVGEAVSWTRIPLMFNHHTYQVYLDDLQVSEDALIGDEGAGFQYLLSGLNAERILIASEAIGDGRFFLDRAIRYANERIVFGRPVASNQGVQFPLARAHAAIEAASEIRWRAAALFDAEKACGAEANMAKLLASEASQQAGDASITAVGGNAFASEFGIERKLRETKLFEIAPISNNLVLAYLAHHALGMPRSY